MYMNTTFAHGNGPYLRTIDLALSINDELERRGFDRQEIIVPLVYVDKDRQRRIMLEEYGDFVKKNPHEIWLDEFHGKILHELFFKTGHYQENLEFLLKNQPKLEERLRDHLSRTITIKNFNGEERRIRGEDIFFEISHNPRVATGYENSYYTTIAPFSEILEMASLEEELDFDKPLLTEVKEKIANKIEMDKKIRFMPEPFVFSFVEGRGRWINEIFTPPFIHPLTTNNEPIEPGMYVLVTGIDGLKNLFDSVHKFGLKLYCSPFTKIEEANKDHTYHIISNPNIKYQFGRTGWSTVWLSHLSLTPLITPKYTEGDDPEIYFNEKTVKKLRLATIFKKEEDPKKVLEEANLLVQGYAYINMRLYQNYGTHDGINYTARIIVDHLLGEDILPYREIKPVFN